MRNEHRHKVNALPDTRKPPWHYMVLICLAMGLMACGLFSQKATPEPRPTLALATLPASVAPRDLAEFYPTELSSIQRGRAVYMERCAECHGDEGRGDGPGMGQLGINPTDFTDRASRSEVSPSWYFHAISKGVVGTPMLSWATQLIEQQRWDVTFYTWSLASPAESVTRGRVLYEQYCAGCHGVAGMGDGADAETLNQPPTPLADPRYLAGRSEEQLLAAITGSVNIEKHDWSDVLTREEQQAIIDYLWTFLYQ